MNRDHGFLLLLVATLFFAAPRPASAQTPANAERVDTPPKGTIGLALVGAELGLAVPAAFRVKNPWILAATTAAGGAGGALAGLYLLDRRDNDVTRALSISFLSLGLAGFIPTVLLTVRASRYVPPEGDLALDPGGGLLRVRRGAVGLGVPSLTVARSTLDRRATETQLVLVSGRF